MDAAQHRRARPGEGSDEQSPLSRRGFLAGAGLSLAALRAAGVLGADWPDVPNLAPASMNGAKWADVRQGFLLPQGLAYLNCGSLGPSPGYVLNESLKAWLELEQNPVHVGYGAMIKRMDEVRQKAAEFLGCKQAEIALTRNTTDGMNTVAQGLSLQEGQRVLTTDHEHPGGFVCWQYYAKRRGVKIDVVTLPTPPRTEGEVLERFKAKLTPATKVISVSHVTFTTGLRMPIRRIGEMARANGSLLVVDGAQAPGMISVNVKKLLCHAYATSGHKWLLGPKGTGLLYISSDTGGAIDPLLLHNGRGAYTAATGYRNVPGIVGLGAAIDLLAAVGKDRVEQRALELRAALTEGLKKQKNVRLLSPEAGSMASGMVSFALPEGADSGALARQLREKHRVVVKVLPGRPVSGLRVSTHVYNSTEDVGMLLAALRAEL